VFYVYNKLFKTKNTNSSCSCKRIKKVFIKCVKCVKVFFFCSKNRDEKFSCHQPWIWDGIFFMWDWRCRYNGLLRAHTTFWMNKSKLNQHQLQNFTPILTYLRWGWLVFGIFLTIWEFFAVAIVVGNLSRLLSRPAKCFKIND
jgi:hypothetical protein